MWAQDIQVSKFLFHEESWAFWFRTQHDAQGLIQIQWCSQTLALGGHWTQGSMQPCASGISAPGTAELRLSWGPLEMMRIFTEGPPGAGWGEDRNGSCWPGCWSHSQQPVHSPISSDPGALDFEWVHNWLSLCVAFFYFGKHFSFFTFFFPMKRDVADWKRNNFHLNVIRFSKAVPSEAAVKNILSLFCFVLFFSPLVGGSTDTGI